MIIKIYNTLFINIEFLVLSLLYIIVLKIILDLI